MRPSRRAFIGTSLALLAAEDRAASPDHITPATQAAIDRGLAFLSNVQASNGSYGSRPPFTGNLAISALAGLAFMAGGNQPGRGKYGSQVTKILSYILSKEANDPPGFLYHRVESSHGPMYSHGFATLFLAELHGMVDEPALAKRLRGTLDRAIALILASQNGEGGWRYRPYKESADVSVTICQIMALRSARNAGIAVPKSAADRCIEYVKACQTPDGGFRYLKQGGAPAFPRSAAGLCALYSGGMYSGKEIDRALSYLKRFKPGGRQGFGDAHYYYGHYYAAQAFWTAGEPHWSDWFPAIRDDLVNGNRQRTDGGWIDDNFCIHYATAMACVILQIPNNYLPILQK